MDEKLNELLNKATNVISAAADSKTLSDAKVAFLGKNGELTAFLKGLKDLPAEERPAAGKSVNMIREKLEKLFEDKFSELRQSALERKLKEEAIDITIDENYRAVGSLHPINAVREKLVDFFVSMGFSVVDGPEIETTYYNFEALNTPSDHPARDMQDTFYVSKDIVLRTQTSAGQIRTMEQMSPPIKVVCPGRTYRSDDLDATHSPQFHQLEGLVVDKGITMCDLKGILDRFAAHFFGEDTKTRFRPSYFPFTEPSVEVDLTCHHCKGAGCKVCKGTGWIEVLGAGMVNRKVLIAGGIDPDVYSGFAFGVGIDRIAIMTMGLDFKTIFDNDIRFLKQYR